ncbi:MAG: type II secretion system protein GspG [Candidatus Omnitrophica bacterium]|nr:type II secretion system protein GspG [Candidatus Omnitrophota bacterium]
MAEKSALEKRIAALEMKKEITGVSEKWSAKLGVKVEIGNSVNCMYYRYEVETPTAIAGVRGTAFMVDVNSDGRSSRIGVVEGEVGVIGGMAEMHAMQMEEATKLVRETGFLKKSSKKADKDFQVFEAALRQYYQDTGSFPTREQGGLKALLKNPGVEDWNGPYVDPGRNFLDPYGKQPYFYPVKKTPKGNVYVEIFSPGMERPIGNIMTPKRKGE